MFNLPRNRPREDYGKITGRRRKAVDAKFGAREAAIGLHTPPERPHPSYRRLSRYDCTGLIWLLEGRPVVALTAATAAIENPTGNITMYSRHPYR